MAQSIQDVMTRDPRTVEASEPITKAAEAMRDIDAGAIIVTKDGEMCGLLTDRDIVVRGVAEHRDPESTTVSEIATTDIESLSPDSSVEDAIRIVREKNVRRIPVVEDGKAVGIVSIGDLAMEHDLGDELADISSEPSNN